MIDSTTTSNRSHIAKGCLSLSSEHVGIKINGDIEHSCSSNEEVVEIWA